MASQPTTRQGSLPKEVREGVSRGWKLFPVKAQSKKPLKAKWQKVATDEVGQLEAWATQHRGCNWGVATGQASGVFVVDLDGQAGIESMHQFAREGHELPETLVVLTARGSHLYFQWPHDQVIRNSAGKLAKGVDIRGEGGYVVIPPSIHPNGEQYAFKNSTGPISVAPQWLLARIRPMLTPIAVEPPAIMQTIGPGQRTPLLFSTAGKLRSQGVTMASIEKTALALNASFTPPLPEHRVREIVGGIERYPGYNGETLKIEQQRLTDMEASTKKGVKTGGEFLAGALLLLVPGVLIHRDNVEKRLTRLVYDLSGLASAKQQVLEDALEHLKRSQVIWRLNSQSAVLDWKRNAGASYDVKRERISVRRAVPPRVESNIVPICIDLSNLKMFFFPDQVLYWQRGTFATIEYKDLNFEAVSTRFIEDEAQTPDSQQVGSTWRYVRKDGGPDRRFSNNRQLPVMLYGVVTAVSSGGLNLMLHTSNVDAAKAFTASFKIFQSGRERHILDEERHPSQKIKLRKSVDLTHRALKTSRTRWRCLVSNRERPWSR
jgi:hypothetical protein